MKLLASLVLATNAQDLYCNTCSYRFDHQGTHIQTGGDERCLDIKDGDNTFRSKCTLFTFADEKLTCHTEFIADWLPDGVMEYTMKRGCKAVKKDTPVDQANCPRSGAISSGFYYRDCLAYCEGDMCNSNNNEQMYELMAVKDTNGKPRDPNTCRSCCSRTNPETALQCMNDPIGLPDGNIKCPIYANAGCFNANFHREGSVRPDEQQYNKGCSPFLFLDDITTEPDYSTRCNTELGMEACKQTCDADSCNTGIVGEQHECYTCSVTVDSALNPLGWGDAECVEGALPRHLESCGPGQDVCVTEMEIDWRPSGLQTVTVRRGCANSLDVEAPTGATACNGAGTSSFRRRTCTKSCGDTKCNQDLAGIEDEFADNIVKTCRACQSGEVIVDEEGELHDCAEDEATSITCPKFMTTGCYSSRSTNVDDSDNHPESLTSHGCSAFAQELPVCTRFDTSGSIDNEGNISEGDGQQLRVCKETCPQDDCNDKVVDPPQRSSATCYQCQQSFNERGEEVGIGNAGCYNQDNTTDINESYLRRCPSGQEYCSVDVEVDWTLRGSQRMTITRGCQADKPKSNPNSARGKFAVECRAGDLNNGFQFKDCRQTFDEGVVNLETDELMQSMGGNTVEECHTCESNRPNPLQCDKEPIEDTKQSCPIWARQGCFKSVSEHYEDNNKLVQETIRGCSTFDNDDKDHAIGCNGFRLDNAQWEVCKQTCAEEDNCNRHSNNEEIFPHNLECFICEETRNHLNETVGFSDSGCFEQPDEKYLHECGPQATMCATMMEVDWTILGSQTVTVRRACGVAQSPGVNCQEESIDNFAFKRCIETTVGPGSNDDLHVAESLSHPNNQQRCFACSHNSLLGPDHENCFADDHEHQQDEGRAQRCPIYANAGCFTADNQHAESIGLVTEVHRGCSTFITETITCAHMDYLDNTDYAVCRQTCTSNGNYACNSLKYPEEEDPCECPSDEL